MQTVLIYLVAFQTEFYSQHAICIVRYNVNIIIMQMTLHYSACV